MRPSSKLAPGDGVISGIVPWGCMRSNRVQNIIGTWSYNMVYGDIINAFIRNQKLVFFQELYLHVILIFKPNKKITSL